MEISIDFLAFQKDIIVQNIEGQQYIKDPIRKKKIVLTPEELVRQLVIQYLIQEKGVNFNRINVEKQLTINGLKKRFDIIVYGMDMHPFLLVECKAPSIPISQSTFEQIAQYNLALKTDYLLVTNGICSYCCAMDYEKSSFQFLANVPTFPLVQ